MSARSGNFAHSAAAFASLSAEREDGAGLPPLSATRLFGWLRDGGGDGLIRRVQQLLPDWRLEVLALPNTPVSGLSLRSGDLLLRTARGQGFGGVAVVAAPGLVAVDQLAALGWRGEGDPEPPPGRYVQVVDLGPWSSGDDRPLARRVATGAGLAPPDTLLVRLERIEAEAGTQTESFVENSPYPTLRRGSRGEAVGEAQTKLNLVHARNLLLGSPGLADCPLTVDGDFGLHTYHAVVALQRLAFPATPNDWDGVIGPKTWAALDALAIAPGPRPSPQPAPPSPPQPHPAPGGPVTAGREVVQHLPLLAHHQGTAPDLILKWNDMAAAPSSVDVAVHLHGHSGARAAMRIDRDKEAISGLDFADPRAPHEAGRTAPTLLVLPRGNSNSNDEGKGYSFPALVAAGGLEQLIDEALARFAAHVGAASVARGRLILTAHSGGGAALIGLLARGRDPDEVHVFDAFYQDPSPIADWARRRLASGAVDTALRVVYLENGSTSRRSTGFAPVVAGLVPAGDPRARRFRVEATTAQHNDIPLRFGWRLLRDAGEDLPLRGPLPSTHDAEARTESFDAENAPHPTVRRGSRGEAVHEAQTKLNLIHAHDQQLGGTGLADCPLAVDGVFGDHTHHAVVALQRLAFPTVPHEWDGVVGPKTWAVLDALATAPGPGPSPPQPPPQPGPPTPPSPVPATGPLDQATVDRLASLTFANAAELNALFAHLGGFQDWFNAELGGRGPFVRGGRGGPLMMPTSAPARARFDGFWDRLSLAYDAPPISMLEFATLLCIVLNETDGDFGTRTETSGRNHAGRTDSVGPHPGLAYFFDKIQPKKASYNRLGHTAGQCFNDPAFIAAHATKGGADQLAGHGDDNNRVWHGDFYPQHQFSTDETVRETEFIREADFYKFRGRGVIQTTGRGSYLRFVRFIQGYNGPDAGLQALRRRWASLSPDDAASSSSNADWEAIFATPDILARALALHAGTGAHDYRAMSRDAAALQAAPAASHPLRGSIAYMGWRISGNLDYARGRYRDRVIALLSGIARASGGTQPAPTPTPPSPNPPSPTPPPPSPPTPTPPAPHPHGDAPVTPPDEATARAQWDAHPNIHGAFSGRFETYANMAPLFAHRGVGDAAAYLDRNIVSLRLFNQRGQGHRDLIPVLAQVEAAIGAAGPSPPLVGRGLGCFNVRPIRGTTTSLSNHALGRAIDLNPDANPLITERADFLVIEAVTGVNIHPLSDPAELRRLSRLFQDTFNEAWVAQQTRPDVQAACHDHHARTRLNSYAASGFCTLDQRLIEALVAAGLRWGGAYQRNRKDFMHFEFVHAF
jgi:hypothetical protein